MLASTILSNFMSIAPRAAFDDALAQRLPLPLAQLYRRAHNAKTPLERHHAAFYLWEAALKLLGSVAIVAYARRPTHDEQLSDRLQNLARPSLGHWWEFVRRLLPFLAEAGDQSFAGPRDLVLGRARDDLPHAAGLDAVLLEVLDDKPGARATVRVTDLFDRLVRYRNREIGHGASGQQSAAHYDRVGRALLAGTGELLSRLDVLAGRQLIYVSDVRRRGDGSWLIERGDLSREMYQRIESGVVPDGAADLPNPERLYLQVPGSDGDPPHPLHPLAVFDPDGNEVLFLNSRRSRKRVEYLSYSTGRVEEFDSLAGEHRELLRRVLGVEVDDAAVEGWAVRSQAEDLPDGVALAALDATRPLGDFERLSELGRGGMGVVYRSWQASLGRQVALKCLFRSGDPKAEARFRREIHALGRVEHPHLVKIFTSGSDGDQWFYAMELIEGATLASVCEQLQTRGTEVEFDLSTWQETVTAASEVARRAELPLTPARPGPTAGQIQTHKETLQPHSPAGHGPVTAGAGSRAYVRHLVELVKQVAGAAQSLHERGIIHRDIKPGNIMVSADGSSACLMDLGLAQLADEVEGRLTKTRQFVGTLRYASPEQVLAVGRLGPASDVYSLGATLWELLTLRPLYGAVEGTPDVELMRRIQFEEPGRLRQHAPGIPRDLEAIVGRCLQKDSRRRYPTASEFARDLQRFLDGKPVLARPVGRLERSWKWVKRRPTTAAVSILLPLAVVSVLAGGVWYLLAQEEREQAARMRELRDTALANEEEAHKQRAVAVKLRDVALSNEQEAEKQRKLAEQKEKEAEQSARDATAAAAKATEAAAEAKRQHERAEQERERAQRERERAERFQYAADMNLAQQAFKENRLFRMRELLLRHKDARDLKGFEWDYLWKLCTEKLVVGPWHARTVRAVGVSPDGTRAVSGGDGGEVKLWDTATGRSLVPVAGHPKTVHAVAFHPDGKSFATAGVDEFVRVWDVATGRERFRVPGAEGSLYSIAFSRDGLWLAVAGNDRSILLCDPASGRVRRRLPAFDKAAPMEGGHQGDLNGVAFSPDGKRLASASRDKTVIVWDVAEGRPERTLSGHTRAVFCVAFSPDGKRLASSDDSSSAIIVWDPDTGKEVRRHTEHTLPVTGVSFSPDGRQLISAGGDSTVRIREVSSGKETSVFYGAGGIVFGGSFSPDGTRIIFGGGDGSTQVLDLTVDEYALAHMQTAGDSSYFLAASRDGRRFFHGEGHDVCLWDSLAVRREREFTGHRGNVLGVAVSPDDRRLVSAGEDGLVRVWDTADGRPLRDYAGHHGRTVMPVAFDPRGRWVATADKDGVVHVWDPATGHTRATLDGFSADRVVALAVSPNGERLAVDGVKKLLLWNTADWTLVRVWGGFPQALNGVAFSPDSSRVVAAITDGTVTIHDERRDEPLFSVQAHHGRAMGLGFSPDGRRLVTGGFMDTVRLWDVQTGQPVLTLPLPATSLALSPDGRRLMTACAAGVGVWFADGKPADKKAVPRRRVQWLVDRAGECEKGKQWDALNFYCNRLIEVDPDLEGSTRHLRAWASFEQDKYEPVVTDVTRYLELKPPTEGVLNLRGRAYYGLDKYALAEADHTRALELDPKSFDGYYYRGLARAGQRKWADAIADYTQALAIDDTGSGPWRLRGVARAELGRWDQAVADFSEALERYPRGRLILSNLTIARLGQGDLPGYRRACLSMYERLTYPDDPETRNSVCWTCCVAPNEVDLARLVTLMDRAVAAEPRTYELLNTRGAVLYRAGRFKDAVKQLREAIEVHGKGGTFEDWVFLAMSHFRLGELETARSDFSRAIEFFDKRLAADSKERPAGWSMRVEWRFLRKEAEELIKPATP